MGAIQSSILGMIGSTAGALGTAKFIAGQQEGLKVAKESAKAQEKSFSDLNNLLSSKEGKQAVDDADLANRLHKSYFRGAYDNEGKEGPLETSEAYQDFDMLLNKAFDSNARLKSIKNMVYQNNAKTAQKDIISKTYELLKGEKSAEDLLYPVEGGNK